MTIEEMEKYIGELNPAVDALQGELRTWYFEGLRTKLYSITMEDREDRKQIVSDTGTRMMYLALKLAAFGEYRCNVYLNIPVT